MAVDAQGNLYIADTGNNRIRRVDAATGVITTVAGDGTNRFGGDGGPAVNASLSSPRGVAVDAAGNLFLTDTFNSRIRRVDVGTGVITTVAGNGSIWGVEDGGPATNAPWVSPTGWRWTRRATCSSPTAESAWWSRLVSPKATRAP